MTFEVAYRACNLCYEHNREGSTSQEGDLKSTHLTLRDKANFEAMNALERSLGTAKGTGGCSLRPLAQKALEICVKCDYKNAKITRVLESEAGRQH